MESELMTRLRSHGLTDDQLAFIRLTLTMMPNDNVLVIACPDGSTIEIEQVLDPQRN